MYRLTISTGILLAILVSQSCIEQDEVCEKCNSREVGIFSGYYRYLITNNGPSLVKYDSSNFKSIRQYLLCEDIKIENTKVINAQGLFLWSCNQTDTLVKVENFEIFENCISIPSISGTFDLVGRSWFVESMVASGIAVLPPCEGQSFVYFDPDNAFGGVLSINSFGGEYSLASSNIRINGPVAVGLLVGTTSQREFERRMILAFQSGSELKYEITENRLKLNNSAQDVHLNLYTK